jgi:molybdopterin-guanine dinucleotide biosynthesis protein B
LSRGINQQTPVITIVGRSGSGKTTFLEKLVPLIKQEGIRLAVIKHDAHNFEMDREGKDTWRMAKAGADVVAISSSEKMAIIEKWENEGELDEVIARLPKVDLIITEGYKKSNNPKIEIHRRGVTGEIISKPEELLAIMTDEPLETDVACYDINDIRSALKVILDYCYAFSSKESK